MNLHASISLLALLSYVGLLVLIVHHSLSTHHASRVLALYLLNMIGVQFGYLLVSLARTASGALLGYTLLMPVAAAQPVLYFFFIQTFLRKNISRFYILASAGLWLVVTTLSLIFRDTLIYPAVYLDASTDLFVPEFGKWVLLLGLPSILFFSLTIIALYQGLRTARSALQRIRIQYLFWSLMVVIAGLASNFSPGARAYPMDVFANAISAALMTYVILRYQLLGIPRIIRTSILYALPTVVIGTGYYLVIQVAMAISHTLVGRSFLWLSFVVAALAAIIAQPLRDFAQRWIDRAFFREKYDGRLMIERLSHTTASLLDLQKLLSIILEALTTTLHIQWAGFFLQHESASAFYLAAERDMQPQMTTHIPQTHPMITTLTHRDTVLTIEELLESQEARPSADQTSILTDLEARKTELLVPLKVEGKVTGILLIGPKQSQQNYTYDDAITLMTLANQTAVAIDNARLHQLSQQELLERKQAEAQGKKAEAALRQRNRELEMLNRVGQEFNSTLDLDLVLSNVLEEVRQLFDVVASSAWLLDSNTDELVCRQAAGPNHERILGWRMAPGQGLAGWAVEHAESIIVPDAQIDARYFSALEKRTELTLHAILVVPLCLKETVIGVLEVTDDVIARFSQDDLTLVESLAATAATAIENARLYEQARMDAITKTALLKEVNHRVGNNLAAIIGLLNAERRYVSQHDAPVVVPTLERLVQRVQGLSEVHSMLSQSEWAPICISDLARQVIHAALSALPSEQHIQVTVTASPITVSPRQASNLALVINELATNTVKHSLHSRNTGHITFQVTMDAQGWIVCEYRDDGPGFPSSTLNLEQYDVGIYLIQRLVTMALLGELTLGNDEGAVIVMRFEPEEKDRT